MNNENASVNSEGFNIMENDSESEDVYDAFEGTLDTTLDELSTAVNNRPKRSIAGEGVDILEMTFTDKQYPSYQRKLLSMKRLVDTEKKSAAKNLVFTP